MKLLRLCLLSWALVITVAAADDTELEVIAVEHRPAAEIGDALRPLLGADEALSWHGQQLLVRARPATLAQVRALLADLDRPARNLRIEVRWGDADDNTAAEWQVLDQTQPRAAQRVEPRIERRAATRRETRTQFVRVIEGQTALIRQGTAIAYPEVIVLQGGIAAAGLAWHDVDSGFAVRPSVLGEHIRITIEPIQSRESQEDGGRFLTSGASTVLEVRAGEWVEIGGAATERHERGTRILGATRDHRQDDRRIFVRVTVE